jgi:predicted transcriptional regulator YdeE
MNLNNLKAEEAFDVIGISARTSNEAIENGDQTIGDLWNRLLSEDILEEISHKTDHNLLALYYDYATDKDGEYTVLLGARVSRVDEVPEGMTVCHVPAQKCIVVTTERGSVPEVVVEAWQTIGDLEDQKKLHRSYGVDYELYDEQSADPTDAQVEIHIGVVQ